MARLRMIRFGNGRDLEAERPRLATELYKWRSNVDTSVTPRVSEHNFDAEKGFTAAQVNLYVGNHADSSLRIGVALALPKPSHACSLLRRTISIAVDGL